MNAPISPTVLIVEDDPGIAELERQRLEEAGYRVLLAATAEEAGGLLRREAVDLILLDYRLPEGVDGLDFYARLKAAGQDLPVILVTGFSDEATVIRALRAGVRDFVTKSVEYLDYLPEAVGEVFRQVHTERELAESQARLASVIDSAQDAVIVTEADQRIILFNPAAEAMFRCPASEALGERLSRFIPKELTPPTASGGSPDQPVASLTHHLRTGSRGVRADGQEFPLEASFSKFWSAGKKFYTVMVRDVTERIRLEEQFRQAQKMEAVGQLAGGVAHDFNNLLTVITGFTELALGRLRADDPEFGLLREVVKAAERASGLTRQLLAFSRKQILQPQVLDLNAIVRESEKMLRRLIGEDIRIDTDLDPDLGRVKGDPGHVEQVLLNLAVNARDAMPQGGQLTITTRNASLGPEAGAEVRPGPYVLLAVADTGTGMDEATKARIFEPFFTTKGPGRGTGLGLSTVFGIARQCGGHVEVETAPGRGSTFRVYLPRFQEAAPSGELRAAAAAIPKGTETILLAEDERAARAMVSLALQTYGYTVLEVGDGEEALRVCQDYAGPIDLLLTDVVMPGMSGRQLAERVRALRPAAKILYASGYTDDAVLRHGVLSASTAFLQKPFTPSVLARKVREVLDHEGEGGGGPERGT